MPELTLSLAEQRRGGLEASARRRRLVREATAQRRQTRRRPWWARDRYRTGSCGVSVVGLAAAPGEA